MNSPLETAKHSAEEKAQTILERLEAFWRTGNRAFATSSFQTHSLPLLHILAQASYTIPVVFLNTGYLFPETLQFRDRMVRQLRLHLIDLRPNVPKSEQRTPDGRLLFAADPDKCCYLNKVEPLQPYLRDYDVWISGVRAEQSSERASFATEQEGAHGILRYHPMLDWTAREVYAYRQAHDLPEHPLESQGYLSIGCMPCTMRYLDTLDDRAGRWAGQSKTECGLHTELVSDTDRQE